jgi:hypothetical protein
MVLNMSPTVVSCDYIGNTRRLPPRQSDGNRENRRPDRGGKQENVAGAEVLVLDALDFLARLAALIPSAKSHGLTYHGVLGPAAKDRAAIGAPFVGLRCPECGKLVPRASANPESRDPTT